MPGGGFLDNVVLTIDDSSRLVSIELVRASGLDSLALTEYYDGVFTPRLIDPCLGDRAFCGLRAAQVRGVEVVLVEDRDLAAQVRLVRDLDGLSKEEVLELLDSEQLLISSSDSRHSLVEDLAFLHSRFAIGFDRLLHWASYGTAQKLSLRDYGLTVGLQCRVTLIEGMHSERPTSRVII